jgi:hypothetical protein
MNAGRRAINSAVPRSSSRTVLVVLEVLQVLSQDARLSMRGSMLALKRSLPES